VSVIRHGEVIEVVYDAERIVVHAPACASHAHAVCDCEPAVFVAADQLQGAVSEARTQAIRDVILMLRDSGIGRDARVADHIERHMLGGQS
jgi:hypothetical protein